MTRAAGILLSLCGALAVASCAKSPPPRCPAESAQVQRDATVRVTTLASPLDKTSGGRLSGAAPSGARPLRAVLLLDYSGSMWGGYDRPAVAGCAQCQGAGTKRSGQPYHYALPGFRRWLAELVDASAPPGADISMRALLFNKGLWTFEGGKAAKVEGALSFPWKLSTLSTDALATELESIPPDPFKATGRNADETHLKPALAAAVDAVLAGGDEGLVWVVTDNIADQTGGGVSQEDARRNAEFYDFLRDDPRLQLVYAYPIHDGERCTWLCGGSLFVYAIHASRRERTDVAEANRMSGGHLGDGPPDASGLLWNDKLRAAAARHAGAGPAGALTGVPLRLKPMDLNAVSVSFRTDDKDRPVPLRCKRTSEFGQKTPCLATVVVRNNLRHERIDDAVLRLENDVLLPHAKNERARLAWASSVCPGQVTTHDPKSPDARAAFHTGTLSPGEQKELQVRLLVPPVTVAPISIGQIFDVALTDVLLLDGTIRARIDEVKTSLIVPPQEHAKVYGAAGLPRIFVSRNQSEVQVQFPATVPVHNDGKLQALLMLLLGGGLALLLLLVLFRFQSAFCTVLLDGVEADRLRMFRFSSQAVEARGVRLGRVRRGVGLPTFVPAKGSTAKRTGGAWVVSPPGGGGLETRVELRQGWKSKSKLAGAQSGF